MRPHPSHDRLIVSRLAVARRRAKAPGRLSCDPELVATLVARLWLRLRCWLVERRAIVPPRADDVEPSVEIPRPAAGALIDDNRWDPLWKQFRTYGPGRPGVTQVTHSDWVIRCELGCVVGGARVHVVDVPDLLVSIDVAIDPRYRRRGYATRLYQALEAAGIDVEAGSDSSMRYGTMTRLGYAFMVGRRAKKARRQDRACS